MSPYLQQCYFILHFLTVCVNVDRVHGRRPLVEILLGVALLCAPLAGCFVAVAGPVHAALVGVRHLYYSVRKKIGKHDKQPWKKPAADALRKVYTNSLELNIKFWTQY